MRVKREWRMASKETFSKFCAENPDIHISYLEYQNIIYGFNLGFRDYLMETGAKAKLPWGFGDFVISKRRPPKTKISKETGEEMINLPVDWKKTRELGHKVYHLNRHTDGFKFSIKWFKHTSRFKSSDVWVFKPYKYSSRLITHYIRKDSGFQHRCQEWTSL